jgi:transcriptional regulator with XRE-family HTH domain
MPSSSTQRRTRHPAPTGELHVRVGALIRAHREEQRLSQAQLGAPNFTRAHISAVELGKVAPSLKTLAFFARKLGVRLRDLIPDEEG